MNEAKLDKLADRIAELEARSHDHAVAILNLHERDNFREQELMAIREMIEDRDQH